MGKAPLNFGGKYIQPGTHMVKITEVRPKIDGFKGNSVIFGFEFESSTNEAHEAGSSASIAFNLSDPKYKAEYFGEMKKIILASLGRDPATIKASDTNAHAQAETLARAACGSATAIAELKAVNIDGERFLIGRRLTIETWLKDCRKTDKNPEGKFTKHNYKPAT